MKASGRDSEGRVAGNRTMFARSNRVTSLIPKGIPHWFTEVTGQDFDLVRWCESNPEKALALK